MKKEIELLFNDIEKSIEKRVQLFSDKICVLVRKGDKKIGENLYFQLLQYKTEDNFDEIKSKCEELFEIHKDESTGEFYKIIKEAFDKTKGIK